LDFAKLNAVVQIKTTTLGRVTIDRFKINNKEENNE